MNYSDIMHSLKEIEVDFDYIESHILSEYLNLDDIHFLLKKENTDFSKIENKIKRLKNRVINKINPMQNDYNVYQLLKIYPYYYFNEKQKIKINKKIKEIIQEENSEVIEDLFFFLLLEQREKELLEIFKILAKDKNIKILNIMKKYFIFKNHIVNYKKTVLLIEKISKI
jgi:predicted amino acid-binding ACT domain protein